MRRSLTRLSPALLALALLAGCGSSSSDSSTTTQASSKSSTTAATQTSAATMVKTASVGDLGTILVDGTGRTLYLFEADKGTTSTCYGDCASDWPPVTTSAKAQAGGSAMSSQLGTTKRKDGTLQITYAGHPLYLFAGDSGPGATKGQGLDVQGGEWYVLSASGKKVESGEDKDDDSDGGGSTSSGSGSGSGGNY